MIGLFGIFPNLEILGKSFELLSACATSSYTHPTELCQQRLSGEEVAHPYSKGELKMPLV